MGSSEAARKAWITRKGGSSSIGSHLKAGRAHRLKLKAKFAKMGGDPSRLSTQAGRFNGLSRSSIYGSGGGATLQISQARDRGR